jgi:hypothetical protein
VTRERLLIAKFGLLIANRMKTFKDEDNVLDLFGKIEQFASLHQRYSSIDFCFSFGFWNWRNFPFVLAHSNLKQNNITM